MEFLTEYVQIGALSTSAACYVIIGIEHMAEGVLPATAHTAAHRVLGAAMIILALAIIAKLAV